MERCKMSKHAKIRVTRSRVVEKRMSALPLALTQDQPSMNWDFRSFSLAVPSPDVKKKTCCMFHVACSMSHDKTSGRLLYDTIPWLPPCRSRDLKNCSTRKAARYHTRDMVHTLWGYQTVLKPFDFIQQSALAQTSELLCDPLFAILYDTKDESHATRETFLRVFL
jgi:hypothetical protein